MTDTANAILLHVNIQNMLAILRFVVDGRGLVLCFQGAFWARHGGSEGPALVMIEGAAALFTM